MVYFVGRDTRVEIFWKSVDAIGKYNEISAIYKSSYQGITGFNLLIQYPMDKINITDVLPGYDLTYKGWEYFSYKKEQHPEYSLTNPLGLIRITGVSNLEHIEGSPEDSVFMGGEIFRLKFVTTRQRDIECTFILIQFYWTSCFDNTFYNSFLNTMYIADYIFTDGYAVLDPPFANDIHDPTVGYPTRLGPQNVDCDTITSYTVEQYLQMYTTGIDIPCHDSIDSHGDINLNNIPTEIGDFGLFAAYFAYGLSVFTINLEGQVAATDINSDGLTLSLLDLAELRYYVNGDYHFPKKAITDTLFCEITNNDGILSTDQPISYAAISVSGNIAPELLADDISIIYAYNPDENLTKILMHPADDPDASFTREFLDIGDGTVESIEMVAPSVQPVAVKLIPNEFTLEQNYPNPFNPTSTISFNLPVATEITLTIFNIAGQKLHEHTAPYDAGTHAVEWNAAEYSSGVYFYKLTAEQFSQSRKMILLK